MKQVAQTKNVAIPRGVEPPTYRSAITFPFRFTAILLSLPPALLAPIYHFENAYSTLRHHVIYLILVCKVACSLCLHAKIVFRHLLTVLIIKHAERASEAVLLCHVYTITFVTCVKHSDSFVLDISTIYSRGTNGH